MSGNKMLKGATVLAAAGLIVKLMGVFFRIPLANIVSSEGLSYYGSVYPIYAYFLILSTTGIPVAISKMVAERIAMKNYQGAHRVFKLALLLMSVIGFATFCVFYFFADFIEVSILSNKGTKLALQAIAPSLLLVPMMSAYRGYFQGRQNMNPTAISQIFEQFVRVVVGLTLVYALISYGDQVSIAGATFGCTAGAAAGLIVVVIIYLLNLKTFDRQDNIYREYNQRESKGSIMKRILTISIPITIGASISPLMGFIDSVVVLRRLQAMGLDKAAADDLWGGMSGFCSPLISMPQVILGAIVISLVPIISAAYKLRNMGEVKENSNTAVRATMAIAMPCAAGIFALSGPIFTLLFPSRLESALAMVPTLRWLCPTIVIIGIMQVYIGILQGIDRQGKPVKNLLIGSLIKLVLTYVLVGTPLFNINGAVIGSIAGDLTATMLCQRDLKKYIKYKPEYFSSFVKPFAASVIMGIGAFAAYKLIFQILGSNGLATILAVFVGVVLYAVLVFMFKIITKEELMLLPKGDKIVKIVGKFVRW